MTAPLRIGDELAGYRIEQEVGRGGMGVVFRAEQKRLGRRVALKVLSPELAENKAFRARFEHESRLAAAIDHPNIVPIFEAGEVDGLLFISMRYVDGTDLRTLLAQEGRLPLDRSLRLLAQVGRALDAAHGRGLVHRDVKPANILVSPAEGPDGEDHCYLMDFGLTKNTSSAIELTATGQFVGTIDYVAPEQVEGERQDGRTDVYALGCVLFECLAGEPPFRRRTELETIWAHLRDEPPALSAHDVGLPPAADAVLRRALAKDPGGRPATCRELLVEFGRAAGGQRAPERPASPTVPAGATRVSRRLDPAPTAPPVAIGAAPPAGAAAPLAPRGARAEPVPSPPHASRSVPAGRPSARPAEVPPAGRRPLTPFVLAAVCLVAVAAGAGLGLQGRTGDAAPAAPVAAAVQSGGMALQAPAPWRPGGRAPEVEGLAIADPVALVRGEGSGAEVLTAGKLTTPGPALLPTAFVDRLGGGVPRPDAVRLGRVEALRFAALRPQDRDAPLTVLLVPFTNGVGAILCTGRSTRRNGACEEVAASLQVPTRLTLSVRPDADYARRLGTALGRLRAERTRGRRAIAAARTSVEQARAADRFAAGVDTARTALGTAPRSAAREAHAALLAALTRARDELRRYAAAARRRDPGALRRAAARVERHERDFAQSVAAHQALGYVTR